MTVTAVTEMGLKTADFDYYLPEELIAQTPKEPRDSAKLLVYDRKGGKITHDIFRNLACYLRKGDVLVLNNTKVMPARIYGNRLSGGKVEFLLFKRVNLTDWQVLVKPARKAMPRDIIVFNGELKAEVLSCGEEGVRLVRFMYDGVFEDVLSRVGEMPLPHYIKAPLSNRESYQTVYAKEDGSCAAPTAGLHFTTELLDKIRNFGVETVEVTLQVGLGTFRPVKAENVVDHKMHEEFYYLSADVADIINRAKSEGRRIIAVGTTSVRVLESAADEHGVLKETQANTDIFIYPPYKFKVVDAMITNFHLPQSTLIMLVSAFAGREQTMNLYKTAVDERYNFFSFGDAMLLL